MAIITISRGSYSKGKDVAEKTAQRLGYELVAREILLEASDLFNIPEIKLVRALHDAPRVLHRFTYGKERYIAHIKAAFLEHMRKDNIVYHGLAGHFFLGDVSHVLKVRILADIEDRVALEMERENIGEAEARQVLKKDDEERRRWSLHLYGIDTWDASLYDMVLHIDKLKVDDCVDAICDLASREKFEATDQSRQALGDLLLAARVEAEVVEIQPGVKVAANKGVVSLTAEVPEAQYERLEGELTRVAESTPGVREVRVNLMPVTFLR
jgi:cytidylate kinase